MRVPALCLFSALIANAQQPDPQVVRIFTSIAERAGKLDPMLRQVRTAEWVAKGGPDTYTIQLASTREQIQAIQADMAALAQHPEHMQASMKGLFRVQAFHHTLDSLMGGLRRYQNPALADLIQSVAAEDQADVEALQTYVLSLADEKEKEFQVVDHEAQRCRATISREPAAPSKSARRTN